MNRLKTYTLTGIVFVAVVGSLAHFVYGWSGQNPLAAPFFPVNESTWEHMKLVFFPALAYGLIMQSRLKNEYPCISSAVPAGILAGTFSIPVLFYTYTGILGFHTLILDIAVFILSVLITFAVIDTLTQSCRIHRGTGLYLAVLLTAAAFVLFSYNPPSMGLFAEPVNLSKKISEAFYPQSFR